MNKRIYKPLILFIISSFVYAQTPTKPSSVEIYESIKKLNFLGSVLYVAAHPDDENTHLISYFANDVHARTAYISLTRGDGGQNLIGSELRELLGVIRTQELLAARRIDGGEQFFSRANDFGYSKHPDETFEIWDKKQVLNDLVYVIREFQPDIIINRFDHRSPGTTHGHHTASAMLSVEAFDLANDTNRFSQQLEYVTTWQPKRLLFNQSWFFYGSREKFEKADKSQLFQMDIGSYFPTKGLSNSEIAAKSRSQHSSQGFGTTAVRGSAMEYLEPIKGGMPQKDIFEGIDTSWNRVKGGNRIGELLSRVERNFDFKNPSASISDLIEVYKLIQNIEDLHWKKVKSKEIKNIIYACTGLFLEAVASEQYTTPSDDFSLSIEVINRSLLNVKLGNVSVLENTLNLNQELKNNQKYNYKIEGKTQKDIPYTTPYWLEQKGTVGMYRIGNERYVGMPETPKRIKASFTVSIKGYPFTFERDVVYKYNDKAKGETYKPFEVLPKISVNIEDKVMVFENENLKKVLVKVKAYRDNVEGTVQLKAPNNWGISPEKQSLRFTRKGEEKNVWFDVTPPASHQEGMLEVQFTDEKKLFDKQLVEINYSHIPEQKVLIEASTKIAKLDIQKKGEKVGYIMGAGDTVPESLRQIGYDVQIISVENITTENLKNYDAVVLGIRAFNVVEELKHRNKVLFDYVKKGGNLIVQYNTSRELLTDELAPLQLTLSRGRVTDEMSEVKFLAPNHPVLNYPNKITKQDFEGWVQERGLYFPEKWDGAFVPIFSMKDKGESALEGSLLVAQYGEGYYVYTGLSFFRELPAGVSGAYRLFANLLSLGK